MTQWRIPLTRPDIPPLPAFQRDVARILESARLSNYGPHAARLEAAAERWLGSPALAFASGDCALAALMATCPSDRVVVSDWTFQSTVSAVVRAGKTPVIGDVDPETLCLSPAFVSSRDGPAMPRAVLATHAHGSTYAAWYLRQVCDERGMALYFDAAHAFRPGCPIGDGAAFSLSGTKVVSCGEGGLLAMPQPKNDRNSVTGASIRRRWLQRFRNYGFLDDYDATMIGVNGKLAELPAALALRSMARFRSMARRRLLIAETYRRTLDNLGVRCSFQTFAPDDVPKDFVVLFPGAFARIDAEAALRRSRIETKRYFRPLSMQPAYRAWWPSEGIRERSRALWDRSLCLPLSSRMTVAQAREVAAIVAVATK